MTTIHRSVVALGAGSAAGDGGSRRVVWYLPTLLRVQYLHTYLRTHNHNIIVSI